ncbi:MAG: dienelactone hydrolase family protein [Gemmatimonadota bacterium]
MTRPRSITTGGFARLALIGALALGTGFAAGITARAAAPAGTPPDSVTTHGEWVTIRKPGGDSVIAYVAWPERKDRAPAIIVIHEIFGLTKWEPTVVDRLAKEGFVAIAPDLLSSRHGKTPEDPEAARALFRELEPERVTADLDATYDYVNNLPGVKRDDIGTIGFCWGGGQSFRYATNNPKLKAAVVCYGPAPDSAALGRINAKVLGVYAEQDARINDSLPAVARRMKAMGKWFDYAIYPGTGHGFLKPGRKGNDGPEVEKAWSRILGFYREVLE